MKRPTIFQLNLLMQLPRDGSYIHATSIKRSNKHQSIHATMQRLCLKGYISEHPTSRWIFRLTDEMITYLNGVKIK